MSWWVVMLLPLPIIAAVAVGTVIGIAVNVSAEGEWRRVRARPWDRPGDVAASEDEGAMEEYGAIAADLEGAPSTQRQSPLGA